MTPLENAKLVRAAANTQINRNKNVVTQTDSISRFKNWMSGQGQNLRNAGSAIVEKLTPNRSTLNKAKIGTVKTATAVKNNPVKISGLGMLLNQVDLGGDRGTATDAELNSNTNVFKNKNLLNNASLNSAINSKFNMPTKKEVKQVVESTKTNPFSGSPFSPKNKDNVKEMQRTLGVKADGVIGPITMKAMEDAGIKLVETHMSNNKNVNNNVNKKASNAIVKQELKPVAGYSAGADEAFFAQQDAINRRALNPNPGERAFIEEQYNKSVANNEFADNMEAMVADNSGYDSGTMTPEDKQAEFFDYLANRKNTVNDQAYMLTNGNVHGDGGEFRQYQEDVAVAKARGLDPALVDMFRKQQSR